MKKRGRKESSTKHRSRRLTDKELKEIPVLYAEGKTYQEIGEMWGFSATCIFRAHKKIMAAEAERRKQELDSGVKEKQNAALDEIIKAIINRIDKVIGRCNNPLALSSTLKNLIEMRTEISGKDNADTAAWIAGLYGKIINKTDK
jgi:hypothetical protein